MTDISASTGFKGGGINPRPFFPTQVQPFKPESLNAYEIGAKSDGLVLTFTPGSSPAMV